MAQKNIKNICNCKDNQITLDSSVIIRQIGTNKRVTKATLNLKSVTFYGDCEISATCGCDDSQTIDVVTSGSYNTLSIDLTHQIDCIVRDSHKQAVITFNSNVSNNQPDLYLEYVPAQIMHGNNAYIDIDANKSGSGKINLATGALHFKTENLVYNSWQAGKQTVQIDDVAADAKSFVTNCGKGWKINAEQHLVKNNDGDKQSVYTYIDGDGNFHEFTERYYYMDDDTKVYVQKSEVSTDLEGKLTFDGKEVKIERRTTSGLELETDYNGFRGSHLLELRQDEQMELEEKVEAFETQLKQYVIVKRNDGETAFTLKNANKGLNDIETFIARCSSDKLLLTESEAIQYNSLLLQQTSASRVFSGKTVTNSSYNSSVNYSDDKLVGKKFIAGNYDSRLVNMQRLVKDLRADLTKLTHKSNFSGNTELNYQYDEYIRYLSNKGYSTNSKCSLNVFGVGRTNYEGDSQAYLTYNIKDYHESKGINTDCAYNLEIDYAHFLNGFCDLQAELERISDDLDEYYRWVAVVYDLQEIDVTENSKTRKDIKQIYNQDKTSKLRIEKSRQKVIEKRLRVFQKEFNNRVEKLQQNIAKFEQEISDYIEVEQRNLVNRQIAVLVEKSKQNLTEIKKYNKQYVNCKHQLDTLYVQLPVNYITSGEGILGFNREGALVAMFDNYENQTAIIYENGKITAIKNSDNQEATFEYNADGLISKITDYDDNATQFNYDLSNRLISIIKNNGYRTFFNYDTESENCELTAITDNYGKVIEFTYGEFGKITAVKERTEIVSIGSEITRKNGYTNRDIATIYYKGANTTVVTNAKGVVTNYIFDQLGRPITVFEGEYEDFGDITKAVTMEYVDDKKSYTVAEDTFSSNILKDKKLLKDESPFYLDGSHDPTQYIVKELPEGATDFVFSAWAKAKSASITETRKFGLRALVYYDKGEPDEYIANYDYLNYDWQFLTLPVEVKIEDFMADRLPSTFPFTASGGERQFQRLELYVDYSNNMGSAEIDCIALRKGKWTYSTFDEQGRKTTEEDSQSRSITQYFYDENDKVIKQVLTDKNHRKFTTTYEYNKQGSLIRSTDYAGLVQETIYDEKGNAVKQITYNKDDPTSKLYKESKRDDKGIVIADVDESGEYDSVTYTYNHKGEVTVQTDGKGNKTAYGYKDENMVSISGGTDGEESTNTMHYTADLLTKASNGDTNYDYTYDGWGRTTKVEIANKTYAKTNYESDTVTKTVLGDEEQNVSTTVTVDKYDKITEQVTTFANGITETIIKDYDSLPDIETITVDTTDGNSYNIVKTKEHDKVTEERNGQYPLTKICEYSDDGNLKETQYNIDIANLPKDGLKYQYETDGTPDKRSSKVQMPFNLTQQFAYDGLGRTKEISLGENLVKDIYYAKYGDHATNRVNSVWHGVNGARKDSTRYTYDKAGNIETVTENGQLVARYAYDGLNRLVREDNVHFGTFTYQYDVAGNIVSKTSYAYTLSETLTDGKSVEYAYEQHGWKDQLVSFNGETCKYDALGNPKRYRERDLLWQGRRLLSFKNGNSYARFTYDVNGIRTSKFSHIVRDDKTTESSSKYIYDGNTLIAEQRDNEWIYYFYGVDGVAGFSCNEGKYLYRKNIQGDITHIYKQKEETSTLDIVAQYVYDAWGNCKVLDADGEENTSVSFIGNTNPFRYRSYYFDSATNLYYLQTRYYDSEVGRFISADSIEYLEPEKIGGLNLYAYCGNNPIMGVDPEGTSSIWNALGKIFLAVAIIAVLAVATVLTAGTAAGVIVAGAFVGAALGAASGVVSGVIEASQTGENMLDCIAGKVLSGTIVGGLSGALAGTGFGVGVQILGNIVLNTGEYLITSAINHESPTLEGFINSAIVGFVAGVFGGDGVMFGQMGMLSSLIREPIRNIAKVIVPIATATLAGLITSVGQHISELLESKKKFKKGFGR